MLFRSIAAMSLCNLADKTKPEANSSSSNANTAQHRQTDRPANSAPNENTQNREIDRAALTVELMKIEYDLTNASFNGDLSTLASFMADDYSGTSVDGSTQTKNQVLASTKPDKTTKSWEITDGEVVSATEDTAVLKYIQHQTLKNGQTYRARVSDTFVKRNGRWLIKSEQQTLMR